MHSKRPRCEACGALPQSGHLVCITMCVHMCARACVRACVCLWTYVCMMYLCICFFCFAGRFSMLFGSGHRTILTLHELLAVRFEDHLRALTSVSSHESVARSSLPFECACKWPERHSYCSIASSTAPREARSCCDCPTENRCKCGDSTSYRGVSDVSRTAGPLRLLWARAISNCDYGRFES